MAARKMRHEQGSTQGIQATFFVVRADRLTPAQEDKLLHQALSVLGNNHIIQERFSRFLAYVEVKEGAPQTVVDYDTSVFPLHGRKKRLGPSLVREVLDEKLNSNRTPGHKSIPAKEFLDPRTLVIIAGSQRYIGEHLDQYLERHGPLTDLLVESLKHLLALKDYRTAGSSEDSCYEVCVPEVIGKQTRNAFSCGNFNELYWRAMAEARSPEEALARRHEEGA